YRQRAELHDLCHRRRARRENAELLRLHAVVGGGAATGVRRAYLRLARARRLCERAVRLLRAGDADLDADLDADFDLALAGAAAGRPASASISISAPSRARPEIAMVVLAGRSFSAR